MSRRVALLGKPVAESLSPRMQNAAFAAAGLDWEYVALEVEPEELESAVRRGWAGANVTIPYKQAAAELCDEAEGESVNTLVFRDGRVLGLQHGQGDRGRDRGRAGLPDRRGRGRQGAAARAAGRGARVLAQRRVAA